MIRKMLTLGSVLFLILVSCEEKTGPITASNQPVILSTRIDSAWNIAGSEKRVVEVRADDPQGFSDLKPAFLTVLDSAQSVVFEDTLYDDGAYLHPESGDLIAGDGVFRNQFTSSQITSTAGEYFFRIMVEDQDGNKSEFSLDTVAFNRSSPLILTYAWASDSLFARDKEFYFSAEVRDTSQTGADISAWFDLTGKNSAVVLEHYLLYNDGEVENHGDDVAGDSLFSTIEDTSFGAGRLGWYDLRFQAENEFKSKSNVVVRSVYIENKAGRIYDSIIPETITIPQTGEIPVKIEAWVSDPQSNADIDSVYCKIKDKNGIFLGNDGKFLLADDGQGDDTNANDGIYTLVLKVDSTNNPDSYTFYFYMRDRVGNLSNTWFDYLEIVR